MLRFINIKELNIIERLTLSTLTKQYYKKIRTFLKNAELIVRIKKYKEKGKKSKFSIHSRIIAPKLLLTSQSSDWDLKRTTHKNFKQLLKSIHSKFRKSKKPRLQQKWNK